VKKLLLHLSAAALCLGSAASAYAKPVGSMSCTNLTQFNVSAYSLGIGSSVNFSSSGAAQVSKPSILPLDVHASIAQFQQFFKLSVTGAQLGTCKLTVTGTDGATVTFEFQKIYVSGLTVGASGGVGKDEEKAAFTDITFTFGQVEVVTNGGADDGGQSPTTSAGWNQITNQPWNLTAPIMK
jgi:hypothetical protein